MHAIRRHRRPVEHLDDLMIRISEMVNEVRTCPGCLDALADQGQLSDYCIDCADAKGIWG